MLLRNVTFRFVEADQARSNWEVFGHLAGMDQNVLESRALIWLAADCSS